VCVQSASVYKKRCCMSRHTQQHFLHTQNTTRYTQKHIDKFNKEIATSHITRIRNNLRALQGDVICTLVGYYASSCDNCLPAFRDNVSVPSSRVKSPSRKERKPATYNVGAGKMRAG
jgi:hypothetical protein